jgi:hypothetical protein
MSEFPTNRTLGVDPGKNKVELIVESIAPPGGYRGQGMHWFKVTFGDGTGHCYITSREAQLLSQLTTAWIEQALRNLAAIRGWEWLKSRVCGSSGLMLHHTDAT